MSEIPQDIWASAQFIAARLYVDCSDHDVEIIARAFLAHERETIERCANIADGAARTYDGGAYDSFNIGAELAEDIATSIRETAR